MTNTINLNDSDIPYNYDYNTVDVSSMNYYYILSEIVYKRTESQYDGWTYTLNHSYTHKQVFDEMPDGSYIVSASIVKGYVFDFTTDSLSNGIYNFMFFIDTLYICGCIKFLKNDNGLTLINSELQNATIPSITNSIQISFQESVTGLTGGNYQTTGSLETTLTTLELQYNSTIVLKYKINKI